MEFAKKFKDTFNFNIKQVIGLDMLDNAENMPGKWQLLIFLVNKPY